MRPPDEGARNASLAITIVAAVSVLLVFVTTDSGGTAPNIKPAPTPGGGVTRADQGGGSAGTGTAVPTQRPTISSASLEANFPIPPGGHMYSGKDQVPDHEVWIEVPGTLESVEAFYTAALPKADTALQCKFVNDIRKNGRLLGGGCRFSESEGPEFGTLQVRRGVEGEPAGVVLAQARFGT